ncbi:xanthine dehydrogenase family protein molybdopterin-binding subunit [Hydrogenophaga sp.]|uniref:xanthine dehydrogenase family protein molybdopterin-binding subunit n=1 Tax=Hydrogenophaga sp. TaxID=1904254 RepID=UPI002FC6E932
MIGQPLPRHEDQRLITGRGQYTDDMDLPGQAWAAFLRSPHAHARILAVDSSAARGMPGVIAVLTGHDYVADGLRGIDHVPNPIDAVDAKAKAFTTSTTGRIYERRQLPLPTDKVRHVGEAVVMVVAETALQARDAAEAVSVDYEVLPAVVRGDDALAQGAPQLYDDLPHNLCFQTELGDRAATDAAFAQAACVVRREFRGSRIVNCQMEPRSAIGHHDAAKDRWLLISGSQGVTRQQLGLADALGVPAEHIRVVSPDVGGGFGPRSSLNMEPVAVLWAARRVGRAVKWTSDRSEAFVSDYQGRDLLIRAAVAFDADGRILALDNHLIGNVGAHAVSYVPMANASRVTTSVYDVPVVALKISAAMSNTVPTGPYRGAGRPETIHAIERVLDIAAHELGIDRIEIRRRNLIQRDTLPRLSPMGLPYDAGDFVANMERVLQLSDWNGFAARRAESATRGKLRGIGLANYIESPVGAPRERIELEMRLDGQLDIVAGTQSTGQGHETTFLQVLTEHLGLPPERMRLRTGDTDFVKAGGGTHSDRSMRLGGTLLVQASAQLLERARAAAAQLLKVNPDRLERHASGFILHRKWWRDRVVGWSEIAVHVARHGLPDDHSQKKLAAQAEFFGRMPAYPTGAAVCELEVDADTGDVELLRYAAVDDVGRAINPLIIEGQIHGGLAQGLGQALGEHYAIDGSGQVLAGSYMDYRLPRAGLLPPLTVELTNDPTHGNPLGVKGGGECGITPATATTFNALADALSAHTREEIPMPATALALWQLIQRPEPAIHE